MAEYKIHIGRNALHAVSLFAGRDDIRLVLCGVLVEATANTTRLVATDGHTIGIHQSKQSGNHAGRVIVPIEIVEHILSWPNGDERFALTPGEEWHASSAGSSVAFKGIDGKFPDYRKAIPESLSGTPGILNPMYVARCSRASATLKGDAECLNPFDAVSSLGHGVPTIAHNGDGVAVLSCGDENMLMMVMPIMSSHAKPITDFAWAKADQP